jgi:hypothetical protein
MITAPFSLTLYLGDATAHRLGYIQVIMPVRDTVPEVEAPVDTGHRAPKVDGSTAQAR